ncbi:MAG: conjugal transfer protein TraF, partial [Neisseriaceae bacterium]|nr:conjugal transfer protein TraF [Neisseriaceae bacterium]
MKNKVFLLFALASIVCGNAFADDDRPRGFLFYDDKQLPTIEPTRKKTKEPKKVIVGGGASNSKDSKAQVSGSPVSSEKPALEPFSVEWLRANMPILLDRAMNNPTEENVRAYKYAERLMLDMAGNFAEQSQKVVQNDPVLDASVRFPISSMARQSALYQIDKAREAIVSDLASKGGIWYFFDTKCRFCESQFKAIKLLEEKYGIETRYISIDGGIFQGMDRKKVWFD